jgi:hypothetical protein
MVNFWSTIRGKEAQTAAKRRPFEPAWLSETAKPGKAWQRISPRSHSEGRRLESSWLRLRLAASKPRARSVVLDARWMGVGEVCTGVCTRRASPACLSQMTRLVNPIRLDFVTQKGAYGIRTRAAAVRGRCPRPLDECAATSHFSGSTPPVPSPAEGGSRRNTGSPMLPVPPP